jgi:hypothetical protein
MPPAHSLVADLVGLNGVLYESGTSYPLGVRARIVSIFTKSQNRPLKKKKAGWSRLLLLYVTISFHYADDNAGTWAEEGKTKLIDRRSDVGLPRRRRRR